MTPLCAATSVSSWSLWFAAVLVAGSAAAAPDEDTTPSPALAAPSDDTSRRDAAPWHIELLVLAQPEQSIEIRCNKGVDCLTPVKASFGGAVTARWTDRDMFGLGATLGLANAFDQERLPNPGYSVLWLQLDLDLELGRGPGRFGAALRVSPILFYGWHAEGSTWDTDLPGFTFALGERDLWVEVGVPTLPTPDDPRLFHLGVGWRHPRLSGLAGVGTFGTVGYQRDDIERAGSKLGAFAQLETPLTDRFALTLRFAITSPVSLGLGFRADLGGADR